MSERRARSRRREARDDVVRRLRAIPEPLSVAEASLHCWRCRLRYWLVRRLLHATAVHNAEARNAIGAFADELQS